MGLVDFGQTLDIHIFFNSESMIHNLCQLLFSVVGGFLVDYLKVGLFLWDIQREYMLLIYTMNEVIYDLLCYVALHVTSGWGSTGMLSACNQLKGRRLRPKF